MRTLHSVWLLGMVAACSGSAPSSGPLDGNGGPNGDSGTIANGGENGSAPTTVDAGTPVRNPPLDASLPEADASGADGSARADATTSQAPDGGVGSNGTPSSSFLPSVQGTCPTIATGTLSFAGEPVQIWAGTAAPTTPGPLVIFWYPTGGSSSDAVLFFGQTEIDAVVAAGGIVAAPAASNAQGTDTGDAVWYTGDFSTTDQVVACALQQKLIDPSRIFTTGASAGGLQATWMAYARSGYIAAVAPISGGLAGEDGFYAAPTKTTQDPTNVPPAIVTHGAEGKDVVIIDFAVASAAYEADIAAKGGFSVDCNTGGGHVSGPPQICPAIWQFFQDHPFKVKDNYPSGLPASFPSYCAVGPRLADGGA